LDDRGFLKLAKRGLALEQRNGMTALHDAERREDDARTRGRSQIAWNLIFRLLRLIAKHAQNVYAVFGIFLLSGAVLAVACTWMFAELAGHVQSGKTQALDDAVMRWMGAHQSANVQNFMIEVTSLGTGEVVAMTVLIAGLFLWLNRHKHSAALLVVATLGGLLLNNLLKIGFDRPRPHLFEWGTRAFSSSFPSGHAMNAVIVYSTVAYLAARLQRNAASRVLTMLLALALIALICVSRLYLGVHYPSDIIAGIVIGLAWAAFCMAVLEAAQLYAQRNAPQMLADEAPAPSH
jgi:undecaprenyl-diphosphatase